jgi:acetylglutamate kinase
MHDVGTLLEALPYIREFHGKTVVIKYGGAAMEDAALREEFARDVVLLKYVGLNPIVVHGGGPEITAYMERLGIPVEFVGGLRVSDAETVEVAKMVLVGKLNKEIVTRLGRHGQPAVGLCGDDGLLFRVSRREGPGGEDIGFVGSIERVNVDVIEHVARDYIPVIASVGGDPEGRSYNVNADEAAGAVARALGAYKLIFLTDVAGVARRRRRGHVDSQRQRGRRARRARRARGRHAPQARGLRARDRRRRELRPHHRRAAPALAAAGALHRRRHRHQDRGGRVSVPAGAQSASVSLSELAELERSSVIASYGRLPVAFVRGEGARLWDAEGEEYLDFLCGVSVTNTGHCHPRVVEAVREQVGTLMHVSNLFYSEPAMRLAERLARSSLGGKVFLCNSGAEANEAAIKLARKARPGGEVVVFHNAFHGRTFGALSATPQESKQAPFAPLVPGFRAIPATPQALRDAVHERTAAVLLEPIQGETGVHVLSDELLRAAREACDRHGAALIFDEVQTGMGRTGTLWAYEQTGVVPDALTSAKALGGGLPIGALVTGARLADVLAPGDHGSTFGGGLVVARAALAALEVIDDEALLARTRELGEMLQAALQALPHVREVRGRGLMVAADIDLAAPEVVRRALLEQKLVVNATGPATVRLLPPLVIDEADCEQAIARLRAALEDVGAGARQ